VPAVCIGDPNEIGFAASALIRFAHRRFSAHLALVVHHYANKVRYLCEQLSVASNKFLQH